MTSICCFAQFGPEQILDNDLANPLLVIATDLDGDDDMDVVATSDLYPLIVWYENIDGQGNFSDQQILTPNAYSVRTISAADIDGDGDVDLFATLFFNKIVWFENLDGLGTFGTENVISDNSYGATNAKGVDIDNDGDLDVVTTCIGNPIEQEDSKLSWYENIDGQGTFGSEHILETNTYNHHRTIYLADIDGDNFIDIVTSELDSLKWYKNLNGTGNFSEIIIPQTFYPNIVETFVTDIDDDGINDIVVAHTFAISWLKNTDGSGNFSTAQIICEDEAFLSLYVADFNNDNDMDVAATTGDTVQWLENLDGLGAFGGVQLLANDLTDYTSIYGADLDGDNDKDIMSVTLSHDKVFWFENLTDLGLESNSRYHFTIYPNPSSEFLFIKSDTQVNTVKVYNMVGQLVLSVSNNEEIDISMLRDGLYFLEVQDIEGQIGVQKFVKQ